LEKVAAPILDPHLLHHRVAAVMGHGFKTVGAFEEQETAYRAGKRGKNTEDFCCGDHGRTV
jgi:hypothetical protein